MKKTFLIIAGIAVVAVITLVVVLALSLDSIIKKGVEAVGPQITKTEMKLEKASISILSGSGALKGFVIGNPEGYKTPSAIKVGEGTSPTRSPPAGDGRRRARFRSRRSPAARCRARTASSCRAASATSTGSGSACSTTFPR